MTAPRSLQARLALGIGLMLAVLWIVAATATAAILRRDLETVFDSALQETAQRILPLAVVEIVGREEEGVTQRLADLRPHPEHFTYVVRDERGRLLLQSHAADPGDFPVGAGPGFRTTATHRLYDEAALRGTVIITVAERLDRRRAAARELQMGLVAPLMAMIPLSLAGVAFGVRRSLAPVRRYRDALAARDARDFAPSGGADLPAEIAPVAATLDALFARLKAAFEAERSFAANAAHELRTPVAGALAQAQRLRVETTDPAAAARADEIAAALKRLARVSERLMQLARAEGAALRAERPADLRPVLRLLVAEAAAAAGRPVALVVPEAEVAGEIDLDVFGIVARNLIDNALRHGAAEGAVRVALSPDGRLSVENEGAAIDPERLARLGRRFERGGAAPGSGLGLAIVATIATRVGGGLALVSPIPGREGGLRVEMALPVAAPPP
jgi:two-component system OmpR family sensor kinase